MHVNSTKELWTQIGFTCIPEKLHKRIEFKLCSQIIFHLGSYFIST